MKAIVYRVESVCVSTANRPVAETGQGYAVLLAVEPGDTPEKAACFAQTVASIPAYQDRTGAMTKTVEFVRGEVTVIPSSQPLLALGISREHCEADMEAINTCCQAFIQYFSVQRLRCGCVKAGQPVSISLDMDGAVSYYLDSETMEAQV